MFYITPAWFLAGERVYTAYAQTSTKLAFADFGDGRGFQTERVEQRIAYDKASRPNPLVDCTSEEIGQLFFGN